MKQAKKLKTYSIAIILAILLCLSILIGAMIGVADITMLDATKIIISRLPLVGITVNTDNIPSNYHTIILNIRLPRLLLSSLVGWGLASTGASLQGMFRNPMADSSVLGISSGASFAAAIAISSGISQMPLGMVWITIFAFVGSLGTTLLVYSIARVGNKIPTLTLLLAGIAVSFLFTSLTTAIMLLSRDQLDKIFYWTTGSMSAANWNKVYILFPIIIISTFVLQLFARDMNTMLLGDETARSLGTDVEKTKKALLVVNALVIASCVAFSGIIGFVGLIIPHMTRIFTGPDHRKLIPICSLLGSIFLIICDTLARNIIPPTELPVGMITALFGAPYFIYLLYKNKKGEN